MLEREPGTYLLTAAGPDPDGSGPITIPLTQDDLASLAGTSRLTVSRVLREMRERGTVEIRRGKLIIKTAR